MTRSRLTIWPTIEQRQWVERRARERGMPLTIVVQLLLEQAMAADQQGAQSADPETQDQP